MKNLHLLPTLQPSRLWLDKNNNKLHLDIESYGVNNQNIYITDHNYEFNQGWYFNTSPAINKAVFVENEVLINLRIMYGEKPSHLEKIVITNDKYLIADLVQPIDDTFLQWFVKNPSCERIETMKIDEEWIYNADVPKEEHKLQNYFEVLNNTPEEIKQEVAQMLDGLEHEQKLIEEAKKLWEKSIAWFNAKDDLDKSELCFIYYGAIFNNNYLLLTDRQIINIWKGETATVNFEQLKNDKK
jgi:hypothetical protein